MDVNKSQDGEEARFAFHLNRFLMRCGLGINIAVAPIF